MAGATGTVERTLSYPPPESAESAVLNGPDPFDGVIDLTGFAGTRTLLSDPGSIYANTLEERSFIVGPKFEFQADMDAPVAMRDVAAAPFDPYLVVNDSVLAGKKYEIHLIGKTPILPNNRICEVV